MQPTVSVGQPVSAENYFLLEKEGVSLYLSRSLRPKAGKQPLIRIQGFWIFRELAVDGLKC